MHVNKNTIDFFLREGNDN